MRYFILSVITLVILVFFVVTAEFEQMLNSFLSLRLEFLVIALLVYFISLLFRTYRWKFLLGERNDIPSYSLFQAVCIGYMVNNILPMRIGEFVRAYFLGSKHDINKATVLVTIFLERVLDAVILIGFLLLVLALNLQTFRDGLAAEYLTWGLAILILAFLTSFILMVYSARNPILIQKLTSVIVIFVPPRFKNRFTNFSSYVESGLTSVKSSKSLIGLIVASVPVWISEILVFCIIGYSMGFLKLYNLNYLEMFLGMSLVTSLANLVSSVPSSPGGIGIFELTVREVILFDTNGRIDRSIGAAFALIVHGILIIPVTILGQILLWTNNLSLRNMISSHKD